jgi:YD repeat-containing protein
VYHGDTGLLSRKIDAANKAVSYTYDSRGRLTQRTWARGVHTNYTYNNADEVRTISYDDGAIILPS